MVLRRGLCSLFLVAVLASACEEAAPEELSFKTEDAMGLQAGAAVYVYGVRVGKVRAVSIEQGSARVGLFLDPQSEVKVLKDACVTIGRYGSEPHVKLEPGTSGQPPLAEGAEISCVKNPMQQFDQASKRMGELFEAALSKKGTIGKLLTDEELAEKVERFFDQGAKPAASAAPSASASAAPPSSAAPSAEPEPPPQQPPAPKAAPAPKPAPPKPKGPPNPVGF